MKQHNSLRGFHHEIKFMLEPVKSDIKKITVFNGGFVDEEVRVTFVDGNDKWILKHNPDTMEWEKEVVSTVQK